MSQRRGNQKAERRSTKRELKRNPLNYVLPEQTHYVRQVPKEVTKLRPKTLKQAEYLRAFEENIITFGIGPAGTGKAQPLDAMIKIPNGWVRMGDIAIGDNVVAADGTISKVTNIYPQGQKQIYKITFSDGRSTECCNEHLWRVYCYDRKEQWTIESTGSLIQMLNTKSKANRLYIELIDSEQNDDVNTLPLDPYVLGAILGDGHIGSDCIRISSADEFIINEVSRLLPDSVVIKHNKKYDYSIVKRIPNRMAKNAVLSILKDEFNLCGKLSHEKSIPDQYLHTSTYQRLSILQGLMDTDGTVDKQGTVSFSSTSLELAKDVQYLVRSIGDIASISQKTTKFTHNGETKSGRLAYTVNIRSKNPSRLFRLPRKIDKTNDNNQYADNLRLRIVSIEANRIDYAQCISIDHPDHLYVTDDFIVTHNTYVAGAYAADLLKAGEIDKIILTRPGVEAGESFGFLPGEIEDKYEPFIEPFMDVLNERLGKSYVQSLIKNGQIVASPLSFMRGKTFNDAVIILDEAQNTTPSQMKMFLTRIGNNSKMIIDGDMDQTDMRGVCGLQDAIDRFDGMNNIGIVEFAVGDIVRNGIIKDILRAYAR